MPIRRPFPTLLLCLLLMLFSGAVQAAPGYVVSSGVSAAQLQFTEGDVAFSDSKSPPLSGWMRRALPQASLIREAEARHDSALVVWTRLHFDRAKLGPGPLALFGENNRERIIVYLNGVDVARTFSDEADNSFGWNRPILVTLPTGLLRPHDNEIVLRLDTGIRWDIAVGTIRIGADRDMRTAFNRKLLVGVTGPEVVNTLTLILSLAIALMWLMRRDERELVWLTALGLIWYFRNLHFYLHTPPFDASLFRTLTISSGFILTWAQYGFCAEFLKVPNRGRISSILFVFAVLIWLVQYLALLGPNTTFICYLAYFPTSLFAITILFEACRRSRLIDHYVMLGAVIACIAMMIHDIGIIAPVPLWHGLGFLTVPYSGFVVFSAFAFSVGRRFIGALSQVEGMNAVLAARVEDATRDLRASESARRQLEVVNAVDTERERIMREMHDGIGSTLTTALAIALRRQDSPQTIATLRRTLSDLKITVDSLEPIEGDVVALVASLRHRIEPDLKEAGIRTVWSVSACPPLDWLNPANALHVLRIMQEGISNILTHADATTIEISCAPFAFEGRDGVRIIVGDDGRGLSTPNEAAHGRGLTNMAARAESIGGILRFVLRPQSGLQLSLWLPAHVGETMLSAHA